MEDDDIEFQAEEELEPAHFRDIIHEISFVMVVVLSQLITQANLGNTVMTMSKISSGLNATESNQQSWFLASFSCTAGAFVLITGRLGDIYGKKLLFVLGWAWLAVWSIGVGFSRNAIAFDICRAFSGIGPAALMPNASALLAGAFPPGGRKNLAFAIFGAIAPIGFFIGAVWGSAIIETGGQWSWIYWSMAIVCAVICVTAVFVVPSSLNRPHGGKFDYLGSFLGVSGLLLVFVSVSGGTTWGWGKPYTGILLGLGICSVLGFVFVEKRVKAPVLPLTMFTSPTFSAVVVCLCLGWMGFGIFQFYIPLYLQNFRHHSELSTSIQFLPCAFVGPFACYLVFKFLPLVPGYVIFGASMLAFCGANIIFALTPVQQTYWEMTFPGMIIIIFGPDLSFASASLIVSDAVPKEVQGVAGSFVNTIVNYSIALGLAVAGNLESSVTAKRGILEGYRSAWWLGAAFGAAGAVMTAVFYKGMSKRHGEGGHVEPKSGPMVEEGGGSGGIELEAGNIRRQTSLPKS